MLMFPACSNILAHSELEIRIPYYDVEEEFRNVSEFYTHLPTEATGYCARPLQFIQSGISKPLR